MLIGLLTVFLFCTASGCTVSPSEDDLINAINDYFEAEHYSVLNIMLGKIEGVPLSEKTYMGTPGYVVEIASITIEARQDKGPDIRKGDRLVFSNAKISVRQDPRNKGLWHVTIISGIAAP